MESCKRFGWIALMVALAVMPVGAEEDKGLEIGFQVGAVLPDSGLSQQSSRSP